MSDVEPTGSPENASSQKPDSGAQLDGIPGGCSSDSDLPDAGVLASGSCADTPVRSEDVLAGPGDETVTLYVNSQSVLESLEGSVDLSRVVLQDAGADVHERIANPSSTAMPEGDSFGRYQLIGEIARGGMGAILRGRDTDLGRDLALKVLLERHAGRPEVIQRFIEEAQISGQLQHPGIAPVYELGQFSDQRPFFTMKLVKGKTLSALLTDRRDPQQDQAKFLGIFQDVCQTLAYAHSRGVLHRDLKPANIMVGTFGEVQVMDWGLAKVMATGGVADEKKAQQISQEDLSVIRTVRSEQVDTPGYGSETHAGSVLGTPAYMAPEQALGEVDRLDERVDVFGLGAILCEILTGQPPYLGDTGKEVFRLAVRAKLDDAFDRLDKCQADSELIAITKQCLSAEPVDRARDAGVLVTQIAGYFESVQTRLAQAEKTAVQAEARVQEERKRRTVTLALTASMMFIVLLGAGGWAIITNQNAIHERQVAHRHTKLVEQIQEALAEAQSQKMLADMNFNDETSFQLARNAVAKAEALAESDDVGQELLDRIKMLKIGLISTAQDRNVVAKLEQARTERIEMNRKPGSESLTKVANLYSQTLEEYGIHIGRGSLGELASTIEARPEVVSSAIIAALDDWILLAPRGLGLRVESKQGQHHIAAIFDASPAAKDHTLVVGDQILGIGQGTGETMVTLEDKSAFEVSRLLQGEPNTQVTLVIKKHSPGLKVKPLKDQFPNLRPDERFVTLTRGIDLRRWLRDLALQIDSKNSSDDELAAWRTRFRNAAESLRRDELLDLADSQAAMQQSASIIVSLAMALVDINARTEGVQLLRTAQRKYADDFWINYTLGVQLHRSKPPRYREAIRFYTAALAIRPQAVGAGLDLGDAYEFAGELDDAIASYRSVTVARPNDPNAWMSLGNALAKRHETEESETVKLVAAISPESMDTQDIENETTARTQDPVNDAAPLSIQSPNSSENSQGDQVESGVKESPLGANDQPPPGTPVARSGRSFVMSRSASKLGGSKTKRPPQSIEETLQVLRQSVKLNPDSPEAQCLLGKAYQRNGDYQQAVQFFEQGHQIAKKNGDEANTEKMLQDAKALAEWGQRLHQLISQADPRFKSDTNSKPSVGQRKILRNVEQSRTCLFFRLNASSASKMYSSLSKGDSKVATELAHGHRLAAARTALFVSMSPNSSRLGSAGIERIQIQAVKWLNTELDVLTRALEANPKQKPQVAQVIKQLKNDGWFKAHTKQSNAPAGHPLNGLIERINGLVQSVK